MAQNCFGYEKPTLAIMKVIKSSPWGKFGANFSYENDAGNEYRIRTTKEILARNKIGVPMKCKFFCIWINQASWFWFAWDRWNA